LRLHSFPGDFPVVDIPVRAGTPATEELRDFIHANWNGPVRDGVPEPKEGESWVITTGVTPGGCVYQQVSIRKLVPVDLPIELVVFEP